MLTASECEALFIAKYRLIRNANLGFFATMRRLRFAGFICVILNDHQVWRVRVSGHPPDENHARRHGAESIETMLICHRVPSMSEF